MPLHRFSHLLILAAAIGVTSLFGLVWTFRPQPAQVLSKTPVAVQARHPASQARTDLSFLLAPQVVVGTPEANLVTPPPPRYTYQNEFPADRSKPLPLYVTDTQTAQELRLGDDTGSAVFGVQNEDYLLWHFVCVHPCRTFQEGLYVYSAATRENRLVSGASTGIIHPKITGDWVAFGRYKPKSPQAALFAANLQTRELITLTDELHVIDASVNGNFGISPRLAAWYTFSYPDPSQIVVYDLALRTVAATLPNYATVFNERNLVVFDLSPGETVVTWSGGYGYDLVTGSYFHATTLFPPNWDYQPIASMSAIHEKERVLSWSIQMKDGKQWSVQAPLIDASPSIIPCVEGQNLAQNGDLEDLATHNLWQQNGSLSDLIVTDLPANPPQAGQWAIRLGRYSNAQSAIQQTLNIPSNVTQIQLAFDVRVHSWDIWGGDQLQVDLIDPITNQSILVTPVQWNNRQLATGGWVPLQIDIQDWPGIDTPLNLVFRATTDWAFPTDFTIDNIRFITACE